MIFYGTKGSHIHSEKKGNIKCDTCNETATHNISVFGKYGYLYWIPVFPMSKKVFSECTNCNATQDFSGMNEKLRNVSAAIKKDAKTPIWYWSGLGVIAILISIGIYSNKQHEKDLVNYIKDPKVGDVIKFKVNESGFYSTLKIKDISNDSIFVMQNNYETDKKTGISGIDKAKNYNTEAYGIAKNRLQSLFDEKIFYDIER